MHNPIEPFDQGLLSRPHGVELYWEASGNPEGRPAIYLHGGPGSGLGPGGYRRRFDPERYLIIGFDQRGCGHSFPWAIDALDMLDTNTTQAMIDDIEALREHLRIHRWLIHGVSWGSTLALAYALQHPDRVTELVLTAVTSGSREEIDWITEGVGMIFPEAWEGHAARARDGERVIDAYARLLRYGTAEERSAAARDWEEWESTHISLDPNSAPRHRSANERVALNKSTLVAHYWSNDCFLVGHERIRDRIAELAGIPGVLIHGRYDLSGPVITPWLLHKAWPGSELHIVESEGHGGPQEMDLTTAAIDRFAAA